MLDNQWATTLGLRPTGALKAPGSSCGFLMVQMYLSVVCRNIHGQHFNLATELKLIGGEVFLFNIKYSPTNMCSGIRRLCRHCADVAWFDLIEQPINCNQNVIRKNESWSLYIRVPPNSNHWRRQKKTKTNTEMSPVNQVKLFWGPYYWKQEADWANKFSGP